MQVEIDKWTKIPLLPCQYLNKWISAVPITVNSRTNFHLLILLALVISALRREELNIFEGPIILGTLGAAVVSPKLDIASFVLWLHERRFFS